MQVQGLYSKPNKALCFKDLGISFPCSMSNALMLKT